ncbi:HAMP domain-containing sensor histidine kinase [Minwuia sp. IMCC3009]|uniref:sensor histidine kinase n=1 Tax=Minwuia sp. IMCC3009 TaxID=3040674 RepID=UPI002478B9A1|nr:HAMP domain-containing sensor histidine kinase [Minwuia sp. IMCC3009]
MGQRKLRFIALTVLCAVGPLEVVDYLKLGWSTELLMITMTRSVVVLMAALVLFVTFQDVRFRQVIAAVFLLGSAILVQVVMNSIVYSEDQKGILLQQVLVSVFGLIFYPLSLRIMVPAIFGFNFVFFGSLLVQQGGADPEVLRMIVWGGVALMLGLFTARQVNRAERLNYLELRRRDIAEAQLLAARQQAEDASRAKSEFLANMSHELRTPLNAVIGFSEMMSHQIFGPLGNDRYTEYVKDIGASGRHLLSLIDEVLYFTKIEAGTQELRFQPIDLGKLSDETVRMLVPQVLEAGLVIQVHLAEEPVIVRADTRAMRQILLNLASNSIKFTDPGGQIDIHVGRTSAGLGFVRIEDTGVGIPLSQQERILRPFEQIESSDTRSRPGWGLGLSIVSVLVRLHDARMNIVSAPGQGTSITITFQEVAG